MSSDLALFAQLTHLALTFIRTHNIMHKEQNLEVITLFACMSDRFNLETIGWANVTEHRISTVEVSILKGHVMIWSFSLIWCYEQAVGPKPIHQQYTWLCDIGYSGTPPGYRDPHLWWKKNKITKTDFRENLACHVKLRAKKPNLELEHRSILEAQEYSRSGVHLNLL